MANAKDEETKDKDDLNDTKTENAAATKQNAKSKKQGKYLNCLINLAE